MFVGGMDHVFGFDELVTCLGVCGLVMVNC